MRLFQKTLTVVIILFAALLNRVVAQNFSPFPKGEIGKNTNNYTGTIWLNELVKPDSVYHFGVAQAVYAPGSKLDWHIHPSGQILLITEGTGYYQEKGKHVRIVHKGDVIKCAPGVEHWHGATSNSAFAYVAISPSEKGKTIWLQRVSDKEYNSIKSAQSQNSKTAQQDSSIFPKGFVAPNTEDYTGTVWLNGLSMEDNVFPFSLMQATFAPGSRLRWHIHPKGQVLLILKGTGYYMEKGKPGRIVRQGDVIKCTPGLAHTHMAAPNSDFAYIGIEGNGIKWLDRVTDEEYNSMGTPPQEEKPYSVGNPLGIPANSILGGEFQPITSNISVYGGIFSAESCSYDEATGLIVVPNRGLPQSMQTNDAWVSLINHDGSVHTLRWIGVQRPDERKNLSTPLVLNEPFGSDIMNGILYLADRDGGTGKDDPSVAVIRKFSMKTGEPMGETKIKDAGWINDIEVKEDGTIYATETGDFRGPNPNPATWKVWKVSPDGKVTVFLQGSPLNAPNGIAFDPQGNVVVVNSGNADVLTFSQDGKLLKTETAAQPGSDGLVIMPDGTKYVCSVFNGGVSRIRPGQPAELIANNIPNAASMCYDSKRNQLVIPMNANNSLAFIPLDQFVQ